MTAFLTPPLRAETRESSPPPKAATSAKKAGAPALPPKASFIVPEARLWLDQTQVVPVSISTTAGERTVLETSITPTGAAEILQPATFMKGEKMGYLRIRSLRPGPATVKAGNASLKVTIAPNKANTANSPEIISPPAGACLYGTITAGVEIHTFDTRATVPEPVLVLSNGRELKPRTQTLAKGAATRLYAFDVNADELPPGPLQLQAYAKNADGQRLMGEPVSVTVVHPDADAMVSGPCAERINDPRPERFGEKIPRLSKTDDHPEEFVANVSADPAWCLRENIATPGFYQLTMRVRGDEAVGSYPSVGIILNEEDRPQTASRLVEKGWHRLPVGGPIWLEAGEQTLTARFLNDFAPGKGSDRNLFLDRYELVRISSGGKPAVPEAGDAIMMSGGGGSSSPMMAAPAGNAAMMSTGAAMQGGAPAMMGEAMMGAGAPPSELRVAFTQALNGRTVQGPITLRATTYRPPKTPTPFVDLLVNGRVCSSQQGRELTFRVSLTDLRPGENTLQLRVRNQSGASALSAPDTVTLDSPLPENLPARRAFRFTAEDQAWDPGMAQRIENDKASAVFYTNGEAILNLPEDLAGRFTLQLDGRGQEYNGPPIVGVFLRSQNGEPHKIGEVGLNGDRSAWKIGSVTLEKGPKQLLLRFANDDAKKDVGDRNWWLRAVSFDEEVPDSGLAPALTILYPADTTKPLAVCDVSAIVARVFSPDGIEWTDLVVDGKPQNLHLSNSDALGRLILPLLTSGLKAGDHKLQVLAHSRNGRETLSPEIPLRVVSTPAKADPAYARAVHLLNRFAYGPEPEELADVLVTGGTAWLKDRLTRSWESPGEQAALRRATAEYPLADKGTLVLRSLSHLLRTPNPARARFVFWAENHFSTWVDKTEGQSKWAEHLRFLQLGPAPFSDLLMASATSPAMLVYLDQNKSFANKLNENYAREIMELHTLGAKGGYRQSDVTELASVLTGWTISSDASLTGDRELDRNFRFEPALNSSKDHWVFGMEFPATEDRTARFDRIQQAVEMLASHPSTAAFISRKLAEHYVSMPAPASLVKKLAARFQQNGGDMADMLIAISESPEFWTAMNRPKMATPLDYSVRLSRMSGATNVTPVKDFLKKSGMGLFDRATPDGYPEADAAYADSNALLQRWRFTSAIAGSLRRLLPPSLVSGSDSPWDPASQRTACDFVAVRLFGLPLDEGSRAATSQYLSKVNAPDSDRLKLVTSFVAQLPQNSLR